VSLVSTPQLYSSFPSFLTFFLTVTPRYLFLFYVQLTIGVSCQSIGPRTAILVTTIQVKTVVAEFHANSVYLIPGVHKSRALGLTGD
jgi:hypothetical protein